MTCKREAGKAPARPCRALQDGRDRPRRRERSLAQSSRAAARSDRMLTRQRTKRGESGATLRTSALPGRRRIPRPRTTRSCRGSPGDPTGIEQTPPSWPAQCHTLLEFEAIRHRDPRIVHPRARLPFAPEVHDAGRARGSSASPARWYVSAESCCARAHAVPILPAAASRRRVGVPPLRSTFIARVIARTISEKNTQGTV